MTSDNKSAFLPFALPDIGDEEIDAVAECMRSGWLTTGPNAKMLEAEFAKFVDSKFALAVNSATAGLHLSMDAIGIAPGDKVLTTAYTFTATGEVIRYMGADPEFVDVDPSTLNINVAEVEQKLAADSAIKAIIPVHIGGLPCDMSALARLAKDYDVKIVEDAAHAVPASHGGKMIGSISDLTVFSFYATKPIATGEGGMITTANPEFAERIRTMRLHGINSDVFDRYTTSKPSWYYEIVAPGFKYNMPDIAAAIGIPQLRKANTFRDRREQIAKRYTEAFVGLPMELPAIGGADDLHAWHLYIGRLKTDELAIDRDEFIRRMLDAGIGMSVHYMPLHMHPYWRDRYNLREEQFPVATDIYRRAFSLPIYTRMTDDDVERVISTVQQVLGNTA